MKRIFFLALAVFALTVCPWLYGTPGKKPSPLVTIKPGKAHFGRASLLVLNFAEPHHAAGSGAFTAQRFHSLLLEAKTFKVTALQDHSHWHRLGNSNEKRLLNAMEEGKELNFDYVMVGEITDYYHGGINVSRLKLTVRIINTRTRVTVFMAEHGLESKAKDRYQPMNSNLTQKSIPPRQLTDTLIRQLIKEL